VFNELKKVEDSYEMLFVVNANRPFTETLEGALKILHEVEGAANLQVTGIVSNAHLIDETTPETIRSGYEVAKQVADELKVDVKCVVANEKFAEDFGKEIDGTPLFFIKRLLLPPWQQEEAVGSQNF
jgi:hypothetical protein